MIKYVTLHPTVQVTLDEYNDTHIYAFISSHGNLFKLHRVGDSSGKREFAFIEVGNSNQFYNGRFDTAQQAIREVIDYEREVYQFDTTQEFLEWALRLMKGC